MIVAIGYKDIYCFYGIVARSPGCNLNTSKKERDEQSRRGEFRRERVR